MIGAQLGSWRLTKLLGAGGMGAVYLAEHVVMGNLWAVKVLSAELGQREDIVLRFINEARAAAAISHRNLVRVVHIDQMPNNGPWYMVLDYLQGVTVSGLLAQQTRPLAPHFVVRLVGQIGNALGALHQRQIVHRDVKADNVFLIRRETDDCFPVLLDLGVASVGGGVGSNTQRGLVLGTPSYMAPEQLLGERVGAPADVYSLGVLAYEMSTGGYFPYQMDGEGRRSYFDLSPAELYRRQSSGWLVDPRRRNVDLSDAFAKALCQMLEFHVDRRLATAQAAALELAKAVPTDGVVPDGLQVLREYASELLASDDLLVTHRSSRPAFLPSPSSEARYALGGKLGVGGMAEVFAGTQIGERGFERPVAIKRVLTGLLAQPGFEEMFVSEARIASRLKHPNIVDVLDLRRDDENRLFIVMEYVDGTDLTRLLAAGTLPASTVIYIIVEVLRGLGYAHDRLDPVTHTRGVVHRDVSPHNVLLSRAGEVKVSDFGLARARDGSGRAASITVRGKPAYMSPEQANGESLDNRSDLWAVGVMLWEMLAGKPLFQGTSSEVIAQVLFREIRPPSAERQGVAPDLEAITMRFLQRDAGARFAKAEDAVAELLRCADAPIDGRNELIQHVAVRFPVAGNTALSSPPPPQVPSRFQVPGRATVSELPRPSTLGSAASESTPARSVQRVKTRAKHLGWVSAAVLAGGLGAVIVRGHAVTVRAGSGSAPTSEIAEQPMHDHVRTVPLDGATATSFSASPRMDTGSNSELSDEHQDRTFPPAAPQSNDAAVASAASGVAAAAASNNLVVPAQHSPQHEKPGKEQPPANVQRGTRSNREPPSTVPVTPPMGSNKKFDPDAVFGD